MNFEINDFDKEIIGDVVNELKTIWIKYEKPEPDNDSPTTESYIENPYWTEYENPEDEMWVNYYNDLIDKLLGFIDLRNITDSRTNPIWYTQYLHDKEWYQYDVYKTNETFELIDGYFDEAYKHLSEIFEGIYNKVCSLSEEDLIKRGYEPEEIEKEDDE